MIINFLEYIQEMKKSSLNKVHTIINDFYKDNPEMIEIIKQGEYEANKLGKLEVMCTDNEDLYLTYTQDHSYFYIVDLIAKGGKLNISNYRNIESFRDINEIVNFICDKITIEHKKILTFPNELSQRFLQRIKRELKNRNYNYKETYRTGFTTPDGKNYPEYELK